MEPKVTTNPAPESTPAPESKAPAAIDWTPFVPKGSEKAFEPYKGKGLDAILSSYVEKEKMLGGSIRLPNEKDTPEAREAKLKDIRSKLGVPAEADKYDLGELPKIHDSWQWDDEKLKGVKAELHKAGFTNDQAKVALKLFADQVSSMYGDPKAAAEESKAKLIEEYGSESMYNRNLAAAQKAVSHFGDADFVQWFEQTGLGNHPAFIKFVAKIGRELAEHNSSGEGADTSVITAAEAQKKLDAILADKSDLYHSRMGTPGRQERINEVLDLHRIVAGEA